MLAIWWLLFATYRLVVRYMNTKSSHLRGVWITPPLLRKKSPLPYTALTGLGYKWRGWSTPPVRFYHYYLPTCTGLVMVGGWTSIVVRSWSRETISERRAIQSLVLVLTLMSAPEGPCQHLCTIGSRYSKNAPMRFFSPGAWPPGCTYCVLCCPMLGYPSFRAWCLFMVERSPMSITHLRLILDWLFIVAPWSRQP
jgi:hypothetical protein